MNEREFINIKCSKCINKNNEEDLCEIRKNIDGEPQCINMKLVSIDGKGFKFEKIN